MRPDGLRGRPARASSYHETPEAWEILAILDRQLLPIDKMLELLSGFRAADLHAAYWLTRRREELGRRHILVDGEDAGRAARIRARQILSRAKAQMEMVEQTSLLEDEFRAVLEEIRAGPPLHIGTHMRPALQVLALAGSAQPLSVRLRRLLAVHPERLEAARARLAALPDTAWLRGRWPSRLERPHMRLVMDKATQLQRELLARKET
jgi:hypothetical protein